MDIDTEHALIDLEEMKEYVEEMKDQYDEILNLLINSNSLAWEGECGGRIFIKATYAAMALDGTGTKMLYIPHYPITSIATVEEDDSALTAGRLNDYVIYGEEGEGYLWKTSGVWTEGVKNIELTDLVAGYLLEDIPADLKLGCMIMVEKEFQKMKNKAGAEEVRVFAESAVTWNFEQDEYVKKIVNKYRRVHI